MGLESSHSCLEYRVDHLYPVPPLSFTLLVYSIGRTTPLPFWWSWLTHKQRVLSKGSSEPWIAVTWTCDQHCVVLTHHHLVLSVFGHRALVQPPCLAITRTISSEWIGAWWPHLELLLDTTSRRLSLLSGYREPSDLGGLESNSPLGLHVNSS